MAEEKSTDRIQVLRIAAHGGVFYTRDTSNRSNLFGFDCVIQVEEISMTVEEYNDIPVTEESKRFFAGQRVGGRAE